MIDQKWSWVRGGKWCFTIDDINEKQEISVWLMPTNFKLETRNWGNDNKYNEIKNEKRKLDKEKKRECVLWIDKANQKGTQNA